MSEKPKNILSAVDFQSQLLSSANNDFESASAKTEDSLLNTRSNSETTSISKTEDDAPCCQKKPGTCGLYCSLTTGVILSVTGILLLIWTPFNILMESRLEMIPGLPPFEWWKDPPQEVRLRAYIFNVTNSEDFMSGNYKKLKMQEIGPIVYLEKLIHKNVTFNNNGTLSYTVNRTAIYLPLENTIDLNATIIVPNYAVLGTAIHLADASFFTKMAFNMLLKGLNSQIFVRTTIYNYLWNLTDPILSFAKTVEPKMVPDLNIGMLNMIYREFEDNATVYIGHKNGHNKFFLLDKFDGAESLPGHGPECQDLVVNSTEGALYPQYITKNMTLRYWRKTLCRAIPLYFEREQFMDKYDVLAYKFTKSKEVYNRKVNLTTDCYKGDPVLPNGLFDVSQCYNGIHMAASYPHYLYADENIFNSVEGMTPNTSLHESYVYVEPLTGIPIESIARSQSNMVVTDTKGFTADLQKFNNLVLPMFWLEYNQVGLPYYVTYLLKFTVNIVPNYQYYFISFLLILGIYFLVKSFRKIVKTKKNNYDINSDIQFEKEQFLKK